MDSAATIWYLLITTWRPNMLLPGQSGAKQRFYRHYHWLPNFVGTCQQLPDSSRTCARLSVASRLFPRFSTATRLFPRFTPASQFSRTCHQLLDSSRAFHRLLSFPAPVTSYSTFDFPWWPTDNVASKIKTKINNKFVQQRTSSFAILMSSWTSENTVGWMKYPLSPCCTPPYFKFAPSLLPLSINDIILPNCSSSTLKITLRSKVNAFTSGNKTEFEVATL